MKLLNRYNYPQWLCSAVETFNGKYSQGDADISATSLIDAPLIRLLKRKHKDEIKIDVHDLFHSVDGTVLHEVLMNTKSEDVIWVEQRFFSEVGGWVLSGQPDILYKNIFDKKILCDLKRCNTGAIRNGEVKIGWVRQINIYRYLLHDADIEVDALEMMCWFKNPGFGEQIVQAIPVKMYTLKAIKNYIESRIALHKLCEDDLTVCPACSMVERWQKPTLYAVCTKSGKSIKNYDTKEEAKERIGTETKYHIEERISTPVRCKNFCSVSPFCSYYQEYLKTGKFKDLEEISI